MANGPESAAYQELILDHARHPHGYDDLPAVGKSCTVANALCGDEVTVAISAEESGGLNLRFTTKACMLCKASASIMAAALSGLPEGEASRLVKEFRSTFGYPEQPIPAKLAGDIRALYDLRRYPSRQRCVLLPWEALANLLYN